MANRSKRDPKTRFDTNALTILLPDLYDGLEVQRADYGCAGGSPRPGTFVVNLGNMMGVWSGGWLRSTMYRINPPGIERSSIGTLAVPSCDTVIEATPDP